MISVWRSERGEETVADFLDLQGHLLNEDVGHVDVRAERINEEALQRTLSRIR